MYLKLLKETSLLIVFKNYVDDYNNECIKLVLCKVRYGYRKFSEY